MYEGLEPAGSPSTLSLRLVPRVILGLALALSVGGCADWPRWSHLPETDPNAVDAPEDLGALIQRTWIPVPEQGDEPWDPTAVDGTEMDHTNALLVRATLDGIGWSDVAVPRRVVADPRCEVASAPRNPTSEGDWLADVDTWVLTAPADGGQLCARIELPSTDVGWDLMLAKLDDCGVPKDFEASGDTWLGYSQGGASGGWAHPLEADTSYAVFVAGYYPNDHARQVSYRLGLSLVGSSDATIGPCPALPPPEAP